jgi:hypothetical protein
MRLTPAIGEHTLDQRRVGFRYHDIDIEIAFPLRRLLGQYVPRVRMAALYLAGGSEAEPLRRTFMRFEFWHYPSYN